MKSGSLAEWASCAKRLKKSCNHCLSLWFYIKLVHMYLEELKKSLGSKKGAKYSIVLVTVSVESLLFFWDGRTMTHGLLECRWWEPQSCQVGMAAHMAMVVKEKLLKMHLKTKIPKNTLRKIFSTLNSQIHCHMVQIIDSPNYLRYFWNVQRDSH